MSQDATGHYRSLTSHEFLGAWDLVDKEGNARSATFTIGRVTLEDLQDPSGDAKVRKMCITPKGREDKKFVLGKTNQDLIAALHGPRAETWVGKQITIYPAQTKFGNVRVDCIRVEVPVDVIRTSPMLRMRVRKKLLAELSWRATQPATKAERQPGDET